MKASITLRVDGEQRSLAIDTRTRCSMPWASILGSRAMIGGMTMGLSMALHEESVIDERFGHVINHDFAGYHIAANADVANLDAVWLDEVDDRSNPVGSRGIGEIGIVGAAAAIANAVYHATGRRMRHLPITPDKLVT